jgi:hypothetical protein
VTTLQPGTREHVGTSSISQAIGVPRHVASTQVHSVVSLHSKSSVKLSHVGVPMQPCVWLHMQPGVLQKAQSNCWQSKVPPVQPGPHVQPGMPPQSTATSVALHAEGVPVHVAGAGSHSQPVITSKSSSVQVLGAVPLQTFGSQLQPIWFVQSPSFAAPEQTASPVHTPIEQSLP